MKKIKVLLLFLFIGIANGQVTNKTNPKSWSKNNIPQAEVKIMPSFDLEQIHNEDLQRQNEITKPYRFGYGFETNYDLQNSGSWTDLPNGDRIWQLTVKSENALTLNFVLENFNLAEGAELYVFNKTRNSKLGPFTSVVNNDIKTLNTWPVEGEEVTLELYEPKSVKGLSTLSVAKVVHGYRSKAIQRSPGDSGNCNFDVDCAIGDNFEFQKKAVAEILVSGGTEWCTGTLLNNTSEDKTPYLMTADHCFSNSVGSTANLAFRFNWKSDEPECPGNTTSVAPDFLQTSYGAVVKAKNSDTDFFLVELVNPIPEDWDVVFAGWSRADSAPEGVTVGISHPSGDLMKIALNEDPVFPSTSMDENFWEVSEWELGVTEGGSSGSVLFNAEGKFIGNLYGGWAACNGSTTNDEWDAYGRFDLSWTGGGTNNNRVSNWLDPQNTDVMELDYLSNIDEMSVSDLNAQSSYFKIYPNPATDFVNVELLESDKANYQLIDIAGRLIKQGKIEAKKSMVSLSGLSKGIYILKLTDVNSKKQTSAKIVVK
ncbi:T9SS type A sorting domain-containing protein [Moheibacter sediminis]|uniref:Por secretion system C-terminal sorting domain-containing protein n=1 Tax=Moheibacter sediminis TaxID=1434700 RepID=A0A1W2B3P5_9FLAO|nr:T9SS type A sorting domain-containing protein [Moheibacter sediminis]SMC67623.1 Por secretion system C-terminal sorting domain-containing protein [Moheibacter sediminis]